MKRYLALLLCLFALPAFGQRLIKDGSGAISIPVNESNDFQVIVTGNITSTTLVTTAATSNNKVITVYYTENAVGGFTVAFGGNITTSCSVTTTAGITTICRWQYDSGSNTWKDAGGGGGANPSGKDGDTQIKNGSNLAAGGANDDGTNFSINRDTHNKGPNPVYDFLLNGGSSSSTTTTGSINSGSPTLTLGAAIDFANGQGIFIPGAGSLPTIPAAPTVNSVTNIGQTGATQYDYCVAPEDYFGGIRACGTSGGTTTGMATLGINTQSITSLSRVSGLDTLTCSATCNVLAGAEMQIAGFAGGVVSVNNGTVIAAANSSGTSVTVNANGMPDYSESAAGTLSVYDCNDVRVAGTLAQESTILRYWIYRRDGGAGSFNLKGVAMGQDPYYRDCNQGLTGVPSYVPATAPASDIAGYLAATINNGGGSTTLTLSANAGTTVSGVTVQHDNGPALKALYTTVLANTNGGEILIPYLTSGNYAFNSTLDFSTISNPQVKTVRIKLADININQPWVLPRGSEFLGLPRTNTSFQFSPIGRVLGSVPGALFFMNNSSKGIISISNLLLSNSATQGSALISDHNLAGGGNTGLKIRDSGLSGTNASAIVLKGGFGYNLTSTVLTVLGSLSATFAQPPAGRFTNASSYLGSTQLQVAGLSEWKDMYFSGGTNIQFDNLPASNVANNITNGGPSFSLNRVLAENSSGPVVRILEPNGAFGTQLSVQNVVGADSINGGHNPLVELGLSTNMQNVSVYSSYNAVAGGPTILGNSSTAVRGICEGGSSSGCGPTPNLDIDGALPTVTGGIFGAQGGASIGYLMARPGAPASCVVSGGGSVPVTSGLLYEVVFTDRKGSLLSLTSGLFQGLSLPGPTCSVNTTGGNQTVTVTRPTPPAGATGWLPFRGTTTLTLGNLNACTINDNLPIPISTTTFVDTFASTCGITAPGTNSANAAGINSGGMNAPSMTATVNASTPQLQITNGAFTSTITSPVTANRTVTLPDASGTIALNPVVAPGNLQSAYDNFNRGSLGANWTTDVGTAFAITGNQVASAGASHNSSFYNAATFGNDQFAEATIVAVGTTAGVSAREAVGQGYSCTETASAMQLDKLTGSSWAALTSPAITGAAGDVVRIEVVGNTITCFQNGVNVASTTDSSYTSGSPGLHTFGATASLDNFSGGNFHPLAQLDVEGDNTQSQHILQALTVGPTNPIAGALTKGNIYASGQVIPIGGISTGSAPPACTAGTAGMLCMNEGTAATNVAGAAVLDANSTTHELEVKTNGSSSAGMLVRVQPGTINQTGQTAAITTATLCAASAGACNVAGQYKVSFNFWGSGTACSSVTAGSVTFLLTWTDENAVTHSAVALQMQAQTGASTTALQASFPFQTALANESAAGDLTISTNGSVIQYATGYTACTTGTGTYNLRASVTRMQ